MEQTVTMMTEEETTEVGPNDIVIHLVNPYKCGMCELEFLEKAVFKEHMFFHLDQIKQGSPSSQIVMNIILPPETPGGVTVTRDILQLGEDGSIKQVLQPTNNITLNQVSPLRELEEAGVIKLEPPKPLEVETPKQRPHVTKTKQSTNNVATDSNVSTNVGQPEGVDGLVQSKVTPVVCAEIENLLKDGQVKDVVDGESGIQVPAGVSEVMENKDGTFSFAFKGPNDEMQHIQIIRPEKGDLMMELTNVQNRRKLGRSANNKNNECDICGKILSSSTNLMRHKMYHSAERPFVCEVCNKGFKDISNLKKHTMIHKRIFPCYLCKKSFLRKSFLAAHLQRHEARTATVKTGNSTKDVTMRTFVDDDGTRVEEMSMAALGGQTFEYKHRIVKADPNEIDNKVKKEIDEEKKDVSDAGTSTDPECSTLVAAADGAEGEPAKQLFTVTMAGLQVAEGTLDQGTSTDNAQTTVVANSSSNTKDATDVDDMPELRIPPPPEEFVKMYQCGHCGKRTVQRGNMMRHLIHHLKEKPFACDECPKQFVDKGELVKHKKTHTKPHRCPQCNGAFAHNVQLIKHIHSECLGNLEQLNYTVMEDGKTYKCDICCIEMKRLGNMIKHVGTHSVGSRRSTWNRSNVLTPKRYNVPKTPVSSNGKNKPTAPYYYDSVRRAFFCGFCSKSFSQKANVHRHVKMHSKERAYQCAYCEKWFPNFNALKRHDQVHTKPFKCDLCPSAFSRKLFLESHKKKHDSKVEDENTPDYGILEDRAGYFCKHCDKKLPEKYRMMSHIRRHLSERPHECPTCNKCFSCRYMLLKHKKIHAKPFICKTCGQTFTRKFFLMVHKKKQHSLNREMISVEAKPTSDNKMAGEEENEFPCSICGAPFARLVIKVNHEKKCKEESKVMGRLPNGKGFMCKICNKVATLKHNLMVHIRKHDDMIKVDPSGRITLLNEIDLRNDDGGEDKTEDATTPVERPEKRPRLSSPKKKGSAAFQLESDGTDEDFPVEMESAEEDADLEEDGDSRYKRTPGGYACLECRRKFTDRDTLMRHLESHGETQTKNGSKTPDLKGKGKRDNNKKDTTMSLEETKGEEKQDTNDKETGESPVTPPKSNRSASLSGNGKAKPVVVMRKIPSTVSSLKETKPSKGQSPGTPKSSVKVEKTEALSPSRSGNRPSRTQKLPSRFLE